MVGDDAEKVIFLEQNIPLPSHEGFSPSAEIRFEGQLNRFRASVSHSKQKMFNKKKKKLEDKRNFCQTTER